MGFFRRVKISSHSRELTKQAMIFMQSWKESDPEMYPGTGEMLDALGDELAEASSSICQDEDDKLSFLKGVRKAFLDAGVSKSGVENIVSSLSPRVMDGRPDSDVADEIMESYHRRANSEEEVKREVVRRSCLFIDASLLLVDASDLNKDVPKVGSCLFFAGSTQEIASELSLSFKGFLESVYEVIMYFGISSDNAQNFVDNLREVANEPFGNRAMKEGKKALEEFRDGDNSGAVRLKRLVDEWKEFELSDL